MGANQIPRAMRNKKRTGFQKNSIRQYKYDTYMKFADTAALEKFRAPAGSQMKKDNNAR